MDFNNLTDPIIAHKETDNKHQIFKKIRPPLTSFKSKQIITGGVMIFILFAVGLGVYLAQQPTQLEPRADEINTQSQNAAPGQEEEPSPSPNLIYIDR